MIHSSPATFLLRTSAVVMTALLLASCQPGETVGGDAGRNRNRGRWERIVGHGWLCER